MDDFHLPPPAEVRGFSLEGVPFNIFTLLVIYTNYYENIYILTFNTHFCIYMSKDGEILGFELRQIKKQNKSEVKKGR